MTAADIAEAAATLSEAGRALRTGLLSIADQFALGARCHEAAATLRIELRNIAVPVTPADKQVYEQYAYTLDALADEPDCEDAASRKRLLHACANGMRQAAGIKP